MDPPGNCSTNERKIIQVQVPRDSSFTPVPQSQTTSPAPQSFERKYVKGEEDIGNATVPRKREQVADTDTDEEEVRGPALRRSNPFKQFAVHAE